MLKENTFYWEFAFKNNVILENTKKHSSFTKKNFNKNINKFSKKNYTLLQVFVRWSGESLPRFCFYQNLPVAGNCRMCLVDVKGSPKPVVACASPYNPGMKISVNSPLVRKARENVLEFLLLNHPLDCFICDQGGECDLQENAQTFGSDRSRAFLYNKRAVVNKNFGPIVKTEMNRCIHCEGCTRFYNTFSGEPLLGTIGRGWRTEIDVYFDQFLKSELSGNIVDRCPVGVFFFKKI